MLRSRTFYKQLVTPEILYEQIKNEKGRPLMKNIDNFQKLFQERYKSGCYFISDITYDSSNTDSAEIVDYATFFL